MAERLVSGGSRPHVLHRHPVQRRLVPRCVPRVSHIRTLHPLVIVRRVLPSLPPTITVPFDPITSAGAAARTDHPEKARGEGERDGKPDVDVDVPAESGMDLVVLQGCVEGGDEGRVEDRGGKGEAEEEEGADAADDGGGDTTQSGEERREANKDFENGGTNGNDIGDEHPFCDGLVSVQPGL